jgi:hypothetical protein
LKVIDNEWPNYAEVLNNISLIERKACDIKYLKPMLCKAIRKYIVQITRRDPKQTMCGAQGAKAEPKTGRKKMAMIGSAYTIGAYVRTPEQFDSLKPAY